MPSPSMLRIFISYRREDLAHARNIVTSIKSDPVLRQADIFLDIDTFQPGDRYPDKIKSGIAACDVLVALVSRAWIQQMGELEKETDFLRFELEYALKLGKAILPITVEGVTFPSVAALPPDIAKLATFEQLNVPDRYFDEAMRKLLDHLKGLPEAKSAREPAVPVSDESPIPLRAFGPLHTRWMNFPGPAAALALVWYAIVCGVAWRLGIIAAFTARGTTVAGFWTGHWGPLFLFLMPLGTYFLGLLLRSIVHAMTGLDALIKPREVDPTPFSAFLAERVRVFWRWCPPSALAISTLLTIVADGRDIFAPFEFSCLSRPAEPDWATYGYLSSSRFGPGWYFGFNLLAWSMQLFAGYCAVLSIALTGYLVASVFRFGLEGGGPLERPGRQPGPRYWPRWDHTKQRCGLETLDDVFLQFCIISIIILAACNTSVAANILVKMGPDWGSVFLAAACASMVVVFLIWTFRPYRTNYPPSLPHALEDRDPYLKPSPWPFASEGWTKFLLGLPALLYVVLLCQVVSPLLRIYLPKI